MARTHRGMVWLLVSSLTLAAVGCGDTDSASGDDLVAWCRAAAPVADGADVLGADYEGDPGAGAVELDRALATALDVAPEEVIPDLARFRDLVVLFGEQLTAGLDRDAARLAAWDHTDEARMAGSLIALDMAMSETCDLSLIEQVGTPPVGDPPSTTALGS